MTKDTFIKNINSQTQSQSIEVEYKKIKETEIPTTIYKYRNWGNKFHKKLITNREVYFPTAQELNDPFDCQRNFDFEELMDPEKGKAYLKIATDRIAEIYNWTPEEKEYHYSIWQHQKMDADRIAKLEESVKEKDNRFNALQGTFTSSLIRNSILLWSHYADSHRGFCVGFNTEVLLNEIKFSRGQEADYFPKLVVTSMLQDIESEISKKIFSKYDAWAYEFEYRIVAGQLRNKKFFASPDAFKEIIFGINMPKHTREEIMYRTKKQIPNINFYEARKVRNEYKIEVVPMH